MTIHPRVQKDLMLAPVAAEIDINLQRIRDKTIRDLEAQLELELDTPAMSRDRDERAELILRQALRGVGMHGWQASITDDGCRIHLDGGSVSIELGLSANVITYIQDGLEI